MKAKFLALAALVLGLASCQTDMVDGVKVDANGEAPVTLQVGLPAETRAATDSGIGAIGNIDLANEFDIRYILEVYDGAGNLAKERMVNREGESTETSFSLRLVPGRTYKFVVWADFIPQDQVGEADYHYSTSNLSQIGLYGDQKLNDESRDAYTGFVVVNDFKSSSSVPLELTRPFAKLRVVTTDMNQLYSPLESATVAYTSKLYTQFNAIDAKVVETSLTDGINKTVVYENMSYVESGDKTLFADYIFGGEDDRVMFTLDVTDATDFEIPQVVFNTNIPVQRNYLTTIKGNVLTDANDITVTIDSRFEGNHDVNLVEIEDATTLAAALTANKENIYVILNNDIDLPISSLGQQTGGSGEYKLGGENTKNITIDLNGNKLNITTTYWSVLGAKNADALFTIKNGTMTSSQASGTWNSYDLCFANCNYNFENVTFDKAIALEAANKAYNLKNVSVTETHDYYAIWVSAKGQNITIDGLMIESAGRGIKIDEQYVNAPAKVTLNINNATFKTAKKAAIVVKSAAGAEINASNLNITEVAADNAFAVWVDENAAAYANLVTVNGAYVKVEGTQSAVVNNTNDLKSALDSNNVVVAVAAGEYTFPSTSVKAGQTIICEEGTVFTGTSSLNINGATVIGATFQSGSNNLVAYYSTINGTYKNCVFNGDLKFSKAGDTVVFENCVFNGPDYALHFDTAVANSHVILKGCEVNSEWRVAIGAAVSMFEAIDTKFNVDGFINLWGKAKFTNCAFNKPSYWICCMDTTEFTNCTCEDRALVADDIRIEETVITINGVTYEVVADGVMKVNGVYEISNAAGLTWFSDQLNNKQNTFAGKTVKVVNDIDMTGATYYGGSIASYPSYCFKGTFDGGEKEISNLTISVENDIHGAAALIPTLAGDGTTIKNVRLKDVNISSSHYAAGIWGYTTSDNCWISVTNCHVEGGTITGNICNGDNADKVGGIGGIFYTGTVSGCSVKDVTISGYRDTAGIVGWAADTRATIKNNTIENVTINVNNTTNYKNYTKRAQYDVNNYVGEGVGKANLEDNTGEATINWGSIAE